MCYIQVRLPSESSICQRVSNERLYFKQTLTYFDIHVLKETIGFSPSVFFPKVYFIVNEY